MSDRQSKGRFITFEGGDGAGKSTQIRLLAQSLKALGLAVVETREPGGSTGAEAIRGLLLDPGYRDWPVMSEALLLFAARRDHVDNVIQPALDRGDWVVCDRFTDSTKAYQGVGQGLGVEIVEALSDLALGGMRPDLTVILDIDPADGLARAEGRGDDITRYELMDLSFHRKLRAAFLDFARAEPGRYAVLDATQPPGEIAASVMAVVGERLGLPEHG